MAELVWSRLGDCKNYVEPFFGSGAVLLARTRVSGVETVNDMDCFLTNFWRAVKNDPDGVAEWADNHVDECDLHARHKWLCAQENFIQQMRNDPDYFDVKIAGWWVWGLSCWIGDVWCNEKKLPTAKIPHLGDAGRGGRRHLGRDQGTHAAFRSAGIIDYMHKLSERFRRVRVCCGDWSRVCGDSVTIFHGVTGVFLDPPYFSPDRKDVYNHDSRTLPKDVEAWAIEKGENSLFRIALCGYEGDYNMPDSWDCVAWKASGGFANRNKANDNAGKERIWFSRHCLNRKQPTLF